MFKNIILAAVLSLVLGTPAVALTVTDETPRTIDGSALPTLWVEAVADGGEGFSHACVPLAIAGEPAAFMSCAYEGGLKAANPRAPYCKAPGGPKAGLCSGSTYLVPQPLAVTPADQAVAAQAVEAIDGAETLEELVRILIIIEGAEGSFESLAERLDGIETRLGAQEETNDKQQVQIDTLTEAFGSLAAGVAEWGEETDQNRTQILDHETRLGELEGKTYLTKEDLPKVPTGAEITQVVFNQLFENNVLVQVEGGGVALPPEVTAETPWWVEYFWWLIAAAVLISIILSWLLLAILGRKSSAGSSEPTARQSVVPINTDHDATNTKGDETSLPPIQPAHSPQPAPTKPSLKVVAGSERSSPGRTPKPELNFVSVPDLPRVLNHSVQYTAEANDVHYVINITKRKVGDRIGYIWDIPRDEYGTHHGEKNLMTFKSLTGVRNKINAAYEDGRLEFCRVDKAS